MDAEHRCPQRNHAILLSWAKRQTFEWPVGEKKMEKRKRSKVHSCNKKTQNMYLQPGRNWHSKTGDAFVKVFRNGINNEVKPNFSWTAYSMFSHVILVFKNYWNLTWKVLEDNLICTLLSLALFHCSSIFRSYAIILYLINSNWCLKWMEI